jgi:hypothetical protein
VATEIDGYTLEEAREALTAWKAAVNALATSQSYTIGTRTLTRVNLEEARNQVKYFAGIVATLSGTSGAGVVTRRFMPRDL